MKKKIKLTRCHLTPHARLRESDTAENRHGKKKLVVIAFKYSNEKLRDRQGTDSENRSVRAHKRSFIVRRAHKRSFILRRAHKRSFIVRRAHKRSFIVRRAHKRSFIVRRAHKRS
jgi:hypothetical protein